MLLVLLPIRPDVISEQDDRDKRAGRLRSHDSDLCRPVARRVLGLEGLRPNDVAHGKASRNQRAGHHSLCVSSYVSNGPLVEDDQRGRDGVDEVDASEQSGAVAARREGQEPAAEDAGHATGDEPGPAVGLEPHAVADGQDADDGDHAAGHVQQGGDLGCVAEGLNDGSRVRGNDTAGDGDLACCVRLIIVTPPLSPQGQRKYNN